MLDRYRGSYLAAGRCLAIALVALVGLSAASQNDPPVGERVTAGSPTSDRQNGDKASHETQQDEPSTPGVSFNVEAIQAPNSNLEAEGSDYYSRQDLKAQQGMAKATEDLVLIGWVTAIISVVGITLLLVTLKFTRDANASAIRAAKAAEKSNRVARKTAHRELRAYVCVQVGSLINLYSPAPEAKIQIKNAGSTPAYHLSVIKTAEIVDAKNETPLALGKIEKGASRIVMGPGHEIAVFVPLPKKLTVADRNGLAQGRLAIKVGGRIEYRDIDGRLRRTNFNMFWGGRYGTHDDRILYPGPTGNDAT
jgi:hypothetical protein